MGRRILIIDDSLVITQQLSTFLTESGDYEIVGKATTGAEGIKLFEQLKPDVVLLDIVMPVMDGIECLRAITKLDSEARVVLVSSIGGVGRKVDEALKLGALDVINKPFEPEKVRSALDAIFEKE
ncbi:response regulator [Myxococcota bacterium]